jgi:hypothetical protein
VSNEELIAEARERFKYASGFVAMRELAMQLADALEASVSLAADRDRATEVKVLRMAAQSVEDTARQGGGLHTAAAAIHREADRIESEGK